MFEWFERLLGKPASDEQLEAQARQEIDQATERARRQQLAGGQEPAGGQREQAG